jgi:hypothetical protein
MSGTPVFEQSYPGEQFIQTTLVKGGDTGTGDPAVLCVVTGHDNPGPSFTQPYTWTVRLIRLDASGGIQFFEWTEQEYGLAYQLSVGMGGNALYVEWTSGWSTAGPIQAHHRLTIVSMDFQKGTGVPMPPTLANYGSSISGNNTSGLYMQGYGTDLFVLASPTGDILALRNTFQGDQNSDMSANLSIIDLRTATGPEEVLDTFLPMCRMSNFGLMADMNTIVVVGSNSQDCINGSSMSANPGNLGSPPGTGGFGAKQWPTLGGGYIGFRPSGCRHQGTSSALQRDRRHHAQRSPRVVHNATACQPALRRRRRDLPRQRPARSGCPSLPAPSGSPPPCGTRPTEARGGRCAGPAPARPRWCRS